MNSTTSSSENIKCLQINLQRAKHSTTHLLKFIEENNIDIIFAQELYTIDSEVRGFDLKFKTLHFQSCDRPKSAIIITNNLLNACLISTFSSNIATVVNIRLKRRNITMISLYCSPLQDINAELNQIQEIIDKIKPQNLIIAMDSNASSQVWFSADDNDRGIIVNDFISRNNLIVINNNESQPTFETIRGKSFIDITLANVSTAQLINNWQVLEDDSLSDHKYITFDICDEPQEVKHKTTIKYNTKKADWNRFSNYLESQ